MQQRGVAGKVTHGAVLRFHNLLIAYANGISGKLLERDLDRLSTSAGGLTQLAPVTAISGAGAFTAGFGGAVTALKPIAGMAGQVIDRAQLRDLLLNNYPIVDQAIASLAMNSVELYANVAVGTNLFRRMTAPGADSGASDAAQRNPPADRQLDRAT